MRRGRARRPFLLSPRLEIAHLGEDILNRYRRFGQQGAGIRGSEIAGIAELAQDGARPAVGLVLEALGIEARDAIALHHPPRLIILELGGDIGIHEEIALGELGAKDGDGSHVKALDGGADAADPVPLDLKDDSEIEAMAQRMRLEDIDAIGAEAMQDAPKLPVYLRGILAPFLALFLLSLFPALYLSIRFLVLGILIVGKPSGEDGSQR